MDSTVSEIHVVCPHCNATNRVPSDKLQAELNCGKCHASLLGTHPDNLGESAFNAQLTKSELPMVVDFWAPWCGPCLMLGPILEEVATIIGNDAQFFKMNVELNPVVPSAFSVVSIPTLILIKDGQLQDQIVGVRPKESLVNWVRSFL